MELVAILLGFIFGAVDGFIIACCLCVANSNNRKGGVDDYEIENN